MGYRKITRCFVCHSSKGMRQALDLGEQPLANSYLREPQEIPEYPLKLMHCELCTHTQLSVAVDPDEMYKDYKYVSGTTDTLRNHFADLAAVMNDLTDPFKEARSQGNVAIPPRDPARVNVLDIGCNDGSLLEAFKKLGNTVTGVDPAENLREITSSKGIPVLVDYWDADAAFKIDGTFEIITALNCLAHNRNPGSFIKGCKRVLAPHGVLVVEFPYFKSTVELADLGQVYAEHHSYFSALSFITLIEKQGMRVVGHQLFPNIHGGTVRFIVQANHGPHANSVRRLVRDETGFSEKVYELGHKINLVTLELFGNINVSWVHGRTVVAYGASAKSSTLFNLPDMRMVRDKISYVVDDSHMKQNLFCPGSNLPILSPEKLKEEDPSNLVILLTVHNFKSEIVQRLKGLGLGEAHLLNYVPEVKWEKIGEL